MDYISKEPFHFAISISDRNYDHKPTSEDYKSMSFHVEFLNVEELTDIIRSGYSMCHIFKNNRRIKNHFMYTYIVFIDVDDSPISMEESVNGCQFKPTIAYTTSSDGKNNLHRFRFIYIFNEPISSEREYKYLYFQLINTANLEQNKDNCGSLTTQLMNGNSNEKVKLFCSKKIYNKASFLQNVTLELYNTTPQQHNSKVTFCKKDDVNSDDYAIRLLNESTTDFLAQYGDTIVVYQTKLEYNEKGYAFFPAHYYRLLVRYEWTSGKPRILKFKDGEGRRK